MQATTISNWALLHFQERTASRYVWCRHSCLPVTTHRRGAPVHSRGRVPRLSSIDPCERGVPSGALTDHPLIHPTNVTGALVWAPYTTATL